MKLPAADDFEKAFDDQVWYAAAHEICRMHNLHFPNVRRAEHGENIVFLVGDAYILKIYTPKKDGYRRELTALEFCAGKTLMTIPEVVAHGRFDAFDYLITTQIKGRNVSRTEWLTYETPQQVALLTGLAADLKQLHSLDAAGFDFDWCAFVKHQADTVYERQKAAGGNPEWLERLPEFLDENLPLLSKHAEDVFVHGDVHFGNLRIAEGPAIGGLFDFADSLKGFYEYEFVAVGVLMIQGQGELQREFFRAYGYRDDEINEELRRRMMLLTILYEHSSLTRYAARLGPSSENLGLEQLEGAIWSFT
jgi:hygromycin-B 7''-O-kinase